MATTYGKIEADTGQGYGMFCNRPAGASINDKIYQFFPFHGVFDVSPTVITLTNIVAVRCDSLSVVLVKEGGFVVCANVTAVGGPIYATFDWTTSAKISALDEVARTYEITDECGGVFSGSIDDLTIETFEGKVFFVKVCPNCGSSSTFHKPGEVQPDTPEWRLKRIFELLGY